MASAPDQRLRLQLQGLVQGVGFRPHVARLASALQLSGWVANGNRGVVMELQGERCALEHLLEKLLQQPPSRARIDRYQHQWIPPEPAQVPGIRIDPPFAQEATTTDPTQALLAPDLAICHHCLAELADPHNRRHRYPFISCTACGPRYSIQRALPFERVHTSLEAFAPCAQCLREYGDPRDRRFHAQTISCPQCGPQLRWNGEAITMDAAIAAAHGCLRRGGLLALKGVGGFHLLARVDQPEAVRQCRRRKGRPDKPLALLASRPWLQRHCCVSPQELELWQSAVAPIVLVRRRPSAPVADAVAGSSPWLGVMRASNGLQQLLLEHCGGALVATSANRSGEPITVDEHSDGEALAALADAVLSHTLPIRHPIDDSVMRWAAGAPLVLRLGRGLAPLALPAPNVAAPALALGAHSKASLALRLEGYRLLSPDLGDLSGERCGERLMATAAEWLAHYRLHPRAIASDQHPAYGSTQLAQALSQRWQLPWLRLQHHRAHVLAVVAEHGLNGPQLGVAWDGSGLGDDSTLWGGEALLVAAESASRVAHLRPFPLPGGSLALREPRRAALGLLLAAWGVEWRRHAPALAEANGWAGWSAAELAGVERAARAGLQTPQCSSIGRLLDGLAALLGLAACSSYEAQAAQRLEGEAQRHWERHGPQQPARRYRLPLRPGPVGAAAHWDWRPLLRQVLHDQAAGHSTGAMALAIHRALAEGIALLAQAHRCTQLVLAGGCFQNALLLELSEAALAAQGCRALWSQRLPSNDAAVAMGQLLAAEGLLKTTSAPWAPRHVSGSRR